MANLIVDKLPDSVNFLQNALKVRIKSINPYQTNGIKAITTLSFPAGGVDGDTFSLSWNNRTIVFTCKTNPNPDISTEYISELAMAAKYYPNQPYTIDAWVRFLHTALLSDYYLTQDFDIEFDLSSNSIVFTAKEFGAQYSLVLDSTKVTSVETSGVNQVLKSSYKIMFNTFIDGIFAFEDRLSINNQNIAEFNLSDAVLPSIDYSPSMPGTDIFKIVDHAKEIGFSYGEFYDQNVQKVFQTDDLVYAIPGGLSDALIQDLTNKNLSVPEWLSSRKDWLTWMPTMVIVGKSQPILMRYLNLNDQDITLTLDILTPTGIQTKTKTLSLDKFQSVEFAASIDSLELEYDLQIKSATVYLMSSTGMQLTVKRIFQADPITYRNEHFFIFTNGLGAFDCIRAMGPESEKMSIDREQYQTKLATPGLNHKMIQEIEFESPIKYDTGSLGHHSNNPNQYLRYLSGFILSSKVFLVVGQQLYPIIINSKKTKPYTSSNHNPALKFEAQIAMKQEIYSRDDILNPSTVFDNSFDNKFNK